MKSCIYITKVNDKCIGHSTNLLTKKEIKISVKVKMHEACKESLGCIIKANSVLSSCT